MKAEAANPIFASHTLLPTLSLAKRELIRFYRQRARIMGSLGTPIVFWALLGSGLQAAFPNSGGSSQNYLEYFFPGNLVLTLLFTAIFTNISIIEDRHEGFLQAVLVAPVSRLAVIGGKVCGGTLIAFFQGFLFLCLAPLAGIHFSFIGFGIVLLAMLLISFTLTTLGFVFAWRLDSVQGFHSIMNLFLMPMWLLSGSFFPAARAPLALKVLIYANPLTYGFSALQHGLYWGQESPAAFPLGLSLGVIFLFGLLFYGTAYGIVNRQNEVSA